MGSFSSKMRASLTDRNDDSPKKSRADASPSGTAESARPQAREEVANEDKAKAGSTSQEQPSETKVTRSFSWLASTPVEYDPSMKKTKDKGKRPAGEGREKTTNIMKYSNGQYLKSVEMPSTSYSKPKHVHLNATSSSSSGKHVKYQRDESSSYGENKEEWRSNPTNNNNDDVSPTRAGGAYPVGFGVVEEKVPTAKACSADSNAYSRGSKGEGCSRLSPEETGR